MKHLRALFLALAAGWMVYSLVGERHLVERLDGGEATAVSGPQFAAGAAVDDYLLKDGALYGTSSLSPEAASIKDCKT
ncbi:MAG TPA: hypothetical protein VGP72_25495 [Planctomycetota bacterium]|jgi:hypothetical protein